MFGYGEGHAAVRVGGGSHRVAGRGQADLSFRAERKEVEESPFSGGSKERCLDEFLTDYVRVYDLVDPKTGQPALKPKPLPK